LFKRSLELSDLLSEGVEGGAELLLGKLLSFDALVHRAFLKILL